MSSTVHPAIANSGSRATPLRAGVLGGFAGGVVIWIYEAIVWVGIQHQMPLAGIPANATGLVFGKAFQASLGPGAHVLGTAIHFAFAMAWGVLFALIWPFFRRRGWEATLVALFYAVFAWIVMHAAIAAVSSSHPDYLDPTVIIGGLMSHIFFTVPLALVVKQRMSDRAEPRPQGELDYDALVEEVTSKYPRILARLGE